MHEKLDGTIFLILMMCNINIIKSYNMEI